MAMLSNLGGVPALILELGVLIALFKIAKSPAKYDVSDQKEIVEDQDLIDVEKKSEVI
ncbi:MULTISPECIES: hypothetical protein [unclassified Peribacillus]|uniref:hypothetical protein n=1 Tax=unclassified Peribacillus TaxID=2675266 RepID=UPI0019119D63|nr:MULTISPECIES: hypothetical protein [unclassified Peribacillus]MBK5446866.1 hypothetical protein [Peribacillus sp. TH24]MBK5458014.1 hypothetical protein [Peribacillus sp. TH27]